MDRVEQEFDSRQYDSRQDVDADNCRFRIKTRIILDKKEKIVKISTYEYDQPPSSATQSFKTEAVLSHWDSLQELNTLIDKHLRNKDGRTRSVTLEAESGRSLSSESTIKSGEVEEVEFILDESDLHVRTSGPAQGRLPFYQKSVDLEIQDYSNLIEFQNILEEILDYTSSSSALELKNPELLGDAEPEYKNGHYQSAVRTAFRVLEEQIREKGDFDAEMTGSNLAQEAFKQGGELEIGDISGEIQGWMYLYTGGFLALRNPPSHRDVPEIDQNRARRILSFVDLLLQTLEEEHP